MPNSLGPSGLQTATRAELITLLTTGFQAIYGADINVSSDTPDGQLINLIVQLGLDYEDLLATAYNGMNPDNAIGVVLDQRVAINGIQRQAGTFTVTPVTITVSNALNLYGLDQSDQPVFTVADNAGNKWELQETQHIGAPGANVYNFQAATPGANLTTPNTINVPVTIVLGVTAINNPTTFTTLGLNEETDAALKIRRSKSVSLSSQGYLAGLLAALENINGVTSAFVYENDNDETNIDGVPGHSIWVIIAGTADAALIAQAIYTKRNAGCGMFGLIEFSITQVDGTFFTVRWDTVDTEELFMKFTATSIDGVNPPNISAIRAGLVNSFVPGVNEEVNINQLATLVQKIDSNTLVTNAGFSLASTGPFTNTLSPSSKKNQFTVQASDIIIIPLVLLPASSSIVHGQSQTFSGYGGFGALTYSFVTNNSGGTINSSTGVYVAGTTPSTDTVRVTDTQGNFTNATVVVT